eukprot:583203-Rhodomonas_salina.2
MFHHAKRTEVTSILDKGPAVLLKRLFPRHAVSFAWVPADLTLTRGSCRVSRCGWPAELQGSPSTSPPSPSTASKPSS